MRLPFKIVKNPKLPKIDRKLDLVPFFTFKNGHQIYTYKVEDLTHMSGRYMDQIKNTINFMIQYNAGPDQVKKFCTEIKSFAKSALEGADRTDALVKICAYADEMPKLGEYVESLESKMWEDLYVMFFVLDTEDELKFTPKENAKKLEYLETCTEEERELFFLHLKSLMISFSTIYKSDTLNALIEEGQMVGLVESLLHPMSQQSS